VKRQEWSDRIAGQAPSKDERAAVAVVHETHLRHRDLDARATRLAESAPPALPVPPAPSFTLNGQRTDFTDASHRSLLDFLRGRGLTGAKEGCAEGGCGSCAVVLVEPRGADNTESVYRVVNSCLLPLPLVADREVYTVEALASGGELAEVQRALASSDASQCGFCMPGIVMSLFAEQYRHDRQGPCDPDACVSHLCRCTGYRSIRDVIRTVGPPSQGLFLSRLARPAPALRPFATTRVSRPGSLDECFDSLSRRQGATFVAGGTDVGVEEQRGSRGRHLVSLEGVAELREWSTTPAGIRIGAGLPLADIADRWRDAPAVVKEWLELFGSPAIRHRATLGGNLATASPIGDAAPLLMACDASVELASPDGRRTVPIAAFFSGYRRTVMGPDEVITAIEIPKPLPERLRFYKVAKRRLDDISTVAAAIAVDIPEDEDDLPRRARVAFGGVAATPIRAVEVELAMVETPWPRDPCPGASRLARASVRELLERVHAALERSLHPMSDHRGSKEYRLALARNLIHRYVWEVRP